MRIEVYKERGTKLFQKVYHQMLTGWMMTLPLLGLLILTVRLQASPTTNMSDNGLPGHSNFSITQEPAKFLHFATPELVDIGAEIVRPHIAPAISNSSQADAVKLLPAAPTAVLMVLTGFLCISLVRDRRVWLAALSAILWTGQMGIQTVPQLANHLYQRTNARKHFPRKTVNFYQLKNTDRARCDIEDTGYISLVNYLVGIPNDKLLSRHFCQAGHTNILAQYKGHPKRSRLLAANSLFLVILLTCRLIPMTKLFYFKPAFILQTLSRGPPEAT